MESIGREEYAEVARLVEVTSDAVALCAGDGTILHVNHQFQGLVHAERSALVGGDIKDLVYSMDFERSSGGAMPFPLNGNECTLVLKLVEGSFIPVSVRAIGLDSEALGIPGPRHYRILVALSSLEEEFAHDRQQQRLLSELQSSNKRLSGMLSIIMSTVGSDDISMLLDTVFDQTVEALEANGATVYFMGNGGFQLWGRSENLAGADVPEFIPYGAGIPSHVLHVGRVCRITMRSVSTETSVVNICYDVDERKSYQLGEGAEPLFKALVSAPIYYGTHPLGVVEVGWFRPRTPRVDDARVLEVISDYLSIELVGIVGRLRSERIAQLERSLNRTREILFKHSENHSGLWGDLSTEISATLDCHVYPVLHDRTRDCYVIDRDDGTQMDLPVSVEEAFFSSTSPAARPGSAAQESFSREVPFSGAEPKHARIARVDRPSQAGRWLEAHGLPSQGVFIDMAPDVLPQDAGEFGYPDLDESTSTALAEREDARPNRMLLLLRDSSLGAIDDLEYDYLTRMVYDLENIASSERKRKSEHRIAQTLQAGMRSSLGNVPGITTDSLYLSATSQALVGGDLYTLIRLPSEQAVMILGDVSGKGIEAASMSSLVKTALSAYAWEGSAPDEMAAALNDMLMSFSSPETFVTAFIAKIDLREGSFTYCSAGHPPAMLARTGEDGAEVETMSEQSGVIGAFESMRYTNGTVRFRPGDILFMYTDGAIEARSPEGEFFGDERLRAVFGQAAALGVDGLCQHVFDALDAFTNSSMDDDIALVALRFDKAGRN